MNAPLHPTATPSSAATAEVVREVSLQVPPAWGLRDIVAVNPYMAFADRPYGEAHDHLEAIWHGGILPSAEDLRGQHAAGRFGEADVRTAAAQEDASRRVLETALELLSQDVPTLRGPRCHSVAGHLDAVLGGERVPTIVSAISRFLATRFDDQVAWQSPLADLPLMDAYQEYIAASAGPSLDNLGRVAAVLGSVPRDPVAAIAALLPRVSSQAIPDDIYLGRLLGEVLGWASYLRHLAWHEAEAPVGDVPALLAIRLAHEVALSESSSEEPGLRRPVLLAPDGGYADQAAARALLLAAAELATGDRLFDDLPVGNDEASASAQMAFCIDVRSERFRRHLEGVAPSVQTLGVAGFFGLPIAVTSSATGGDRPQCPPLLQPMASVPVDATPKAGAWGSWRSGLTSLGGGSVGVLQYVETLGLGHLGQLVRDTLGHTPTSADHHDGHLHLDALSREDRVALAKSVWSTLALKDPAPLVVLCGHEATVVNNPQAAGLQCGACAGHGGAINARLAAGLLNDPEVREQLAGLDLSVPDHVRVIAAVHDTTRDLVTILDREAIPASHRGALAELEDALQSAGKKVRHERARTLPGAPEASTLARRSSDWAEVFPEWGLAGNAAFLVGRRARSRGRDLAGRSFLHDYDPSADHDGSRLAGILTAPGIVTSWINLQYHASSVHPTRLGSGTKTLHNVVGTAGVLLGADGDLAQGLAAQSLGDGETPQHQPVRIRLVVEAPRERIATVVSGHEGLRNLVNNGWILLDALDPASSRRTRWVPGQGF